MSSPIYETAISFEDIDRIIGKIYPVIADESSPLVIAAMISMVVMAMNPGASGEVLIKQIEEISQFITMNLLTPTDAPESPTDVPKVTLN
jgi:hypothetical protein